MNGIVGVTGRTRPTWALLFMLATTLTSVSSQSLQQRADSVFGQFAEAPGCAVGVDHAGERLMRSGYGIADLEWNAPITPETIFEAGSVSKQFTAAAILLLEARGQLSLDDTLQLWFPEIPRYQQPIILRNLMLHTSGLRDWGAVASLAGWPRTTRTHDHDDALAIIVRQVGLNHEPGERFSYTNTGYNLMAMLVQRVTGQSMAEFTRGEFFKPLGMNNTSWRDDFTRVVPGRAQAYRLAGEEWKLLMPFENVYGNGGLLTTVGDLLLWTDALLEGRIGTPNIGHRMQEMGLLNDGSPSGYGGGLFLNPVRGVRVVRHTGATAGYRAVLSAWVDQELRVAILCNRADAAVSEKEIELLRGLVPFGTDPRQASSRGAEGGTNDVFFAVDRDQLPEYEGSYHSQEVGHTIIIGALRGGLGATRRPGESPYRLISRGGERFLGPGSSRYLFERDGAGKVISLRVSVSRALNVLYQRVE